MAERKILRGVRVGNKTYSEGMEDELAGVLDPGEAERLTNKGYLEGWIAKAKEEPAAKTKKEK